MMRCCIIHKSRYVFKIPYAIYFLLRCTFIVSDEILLLFSVRHKVRYKSPLYHVPDCRLISEPRLKTMTFMIERILSNNI